MKVLDNVTVLRPADQIVPMLRLLADELEANPSTLNVFLVIEDEEHDSLDVRCFGETECNYRAAGVLMKAIRDMLP